MRRFWGSGPRLSSSVETLGHQFEGRRQRPHVWRGEWSSICESDFQMLPPQTGCAAFCAIVKRIFRDDRFASDSIYSLLVHPHLVQSGRHQGSLVRVGKEGYHQVSTISTDSAEWIQQTAALVELGKKKASQNRKRIDVSTVGSLYEHAYNYCNYIWKIATCFHADLGYSQPGVGRVSASWLAPSQIQNRLPLLATPLFCRSTSPPRGPYLPEI
ncbi:hypothetical protein V2G26_015099 [Clonostachys chloroleuca]